MKTTHANPTVAPSPPPARRSERFVQRADIVTKRIDDEAVLYDMARDTVHYLNATSAFVWRQCGHGAATRDIVAAAAILYADAASAGEIASGVHAAIELLRRDGLLERSTP